MPHCTTNFVWYLGKFIIGFTGMIFLYASFLKENEKSCICSARMRELLRQKSKKRPDRCECTEGMRNKRYPCGCNKSIIPRMQDDNAVPAVANEYIKRTCVRSRCCMRRNSY